MRGAIVLALLAPLALADRLAAKPAGKSAKAGPPPTPAARGVLAPLGKKHQVEIVVYRKGVEVLIRDLRGQVIPVAARDVTLEVILTDKDGQPRRDLELKPKETNRLWAAADLEAVLRLTAAITAKIDGKREKAQVKWGLLDTKRIRDVGFEDLPF